MPEKRFTRGEARAAILAAGLDLTVERGPSLGLDRVSFAEAIERSGVPRPSAYRAFADPDREPQTRFRSEVAVRIISSCAFRDLSSTADATAPIFERASADDVTSEELTQLLREFVRLAPIIYQQQCQTDPMFPAYFSVLIGATNDAVDSELMAELRHEEVAAAAGFIEFYRVVFAMLGLRLRSGWTWEAFSTAVTAAQTGDYLMTDISDHATMDRPTGPDGAMQRWTTFGLLAEGLFIAATEPDPKMVVAADPRLWVS